jgi:transcription antitermination factor NusG
MQADVPSPGFPQDLLLENREVRWYAVYTCPRHEKKVAQQLGQRCVEAYLPLYRAVRRWNQRRAEVQLPLFPGYVFTRIQLRERLRVLEVPGVVRLVGSGARPAPMADEEMAAVRNCLDLRTAQPYPYLGAGKRVRISTGPLAGLEGVIQRRKGRARIVVSIDCIMRSIAIELEACDVELLTSRRWGPLQALHFPV